MKYELFIARRLKTGGDDSTSSSSAILNVALSAIVLAIVIMILSVVIVCGFKAEITNKLYNLTPHISITSLYPSTDGLHCVNADSISKAILCKKDIESIQIITDKPAVLKTTTDFNGITLRGCDKIDTLYWNKLLVDGCLPNFQSNNRDIIISQLTARQLNLKCGDTILSYFIDENIRALKFNVTGIYNSDFEDFDNNFVLCPASIVRHLNGWENNEGSLIAISCKNTDIISDISYDIYQQITKDYIAKGKAMPYSISNTQQDYISYFSWLSLLDTNIVIILVIMAIVSGFTLIAGLLIIVLGRIHTIGLMKALGATDSSIRNIFILLAQKLILKAMLYGNAIAIILALLQKHFHIISLDPSSYYMSFVPIEINILHVLLLNVGIIVVSYITLVFPSYIISKISPSKSLRYE